MNGKLFPAVAAVKNSGLGKKLQMLTGKGQVRTIRVHNQDASTVYLMLLDRTAEPVGGEVPVVAPIPLAAGGYYESSAAVDFANGCWLVASTTADGYGPIAADTVWLSGTVN